MCMLTMADHVLQLAHPDHGTVVTQVLQYQGWTLCVADAV